MEFELYLDDDINVGFIDGNKIAENLLFCKNITEKVKIEDLFVIFNRFRSEKSLDWTNNKCIDVCTAICRAVIKHYSHLLEANHMIYSGLIPLFTRKSLR